MERVEIRLGWERKRVRMSFLRFQDGMVSDSDSVDTEGYFTSFRNECGFPKSKKGTKDGKEDKGPPSANTTENEYELFGKGSTSTTASSCGTVVLRNKPSPPLRTSSVEHLIDKKAQSVICSTNLSLRLRTETN